MQNISQSSKTKIITIPNILTLFRIALIPVFIWTYCIKQEYLVTAGVLLLSGLTDTVDGFIARRFNMISDVGKALDPIADKLTQGAMLFCLIKRFPLMIFPLGLLIVKETATGAFSLLVIKKTGEVLGADWHGKVTTGLLYLMMIIHVLWYDIPAAASKILILTCIAMMLLSFILYCIRNTKALTANEKSLHRLLR